MKRTYRLILISSIFLLLTIFVLLLTFSWPAYNSVDWGKTWENWEKATSTAEHIATVAALIVGGTWAYIRFIKGRVDRARLEPSVSGKILTYGTRPYLCISMCIKNVGLTQTKIEQEGTGLDVYVCSAEIKSPSIESVEWGEPVTTIEVFTGHKWIEPNETIVDQKLIAFPVERELIIRVDLVLSSKLHDVQWRATAVIEPRQYDSSQRATSLS